MWWKPDRKDSSIGIPFDFLLRDIAQYDKTYDDSFNRIYNATRTCAIFIGLGSNWTNDFRLVSATAAHDILEY